MLVACRISLPDDERCRRSADSRDYEPGQRVDGERGCGGRERGEWTVAAHRRCGEGEEVGGVDAKSEEQMRQAAGAGKKKPLRRTGREKERGSSSDCDDDWDPSSG